MNEKSLKIFFRNFKRMFHMRRMQSFFAIKSFASKKPALITLNSIDLEDENDFNLKDYQNYKENYEPNQRLTTLNYISLKI